MEESKLDLEVTLAPLPFNVFLRTSDGKLTLKAAFNSDLRAGAWVIGMNHSSDVECRIFEERDSGLFEVTHAAVQKAADALKLEIRSRKP